MNVKEVLSVSRVSKREDVFYSMFREFGESIAKAGKTFYEIVEGYPETATRIPEIKSYESMCDEHMKNIMTELYSSFITPFDREDITELTRQLDAIVDAMEGCAARFELFHVDKMHKEAIEMAKITAHATSELAAALDNFKEFKKDRSVMEKAISIGHIEDEGDMVYRHGLARMYEEKHDPLETLKWTGLLDKMEDALDACADAASTMQAVIIKNA